MGNCKKLLTQTLFISFSQDLSKSGKEFDFLSGAYSLRLLVGDAVAENAFDWHVVSCSKGLCPLEYFRDFSAHDLALVSFAEFHKPLEA